LYVTIPLLKFNAEAVKVIGVPTHTPPFIFDVSVTDGVITGLTSIEIILEVAIFADRQLPLVIVISQLTLSPFNKEVDV
jgi:hypothetical protein